MTQILLEHGSDEKLATNMKMAIFCDTLNLLYNIYLQIKLSPWKYVHLHNHPPNDMWQH